MAIATKQILGMLAPVDKCLQSRETDLQQAETLIETVKDDLKSLRCDEADEENWTTATSLISDGVDNEKPARPQCHWITKGKLGNLLVLIYTGGAAMDQDESCGPKTCMKHLF